jgi:hypothetical protein
MAAPKIEVFRSVTYNKPERMVKNYDQILMLAFLGKKLEEMRFQTI